MVVRGNFCDGISGLVGLVVITVVSVGCCLLGLQLHACGLAVFAAFARFFFCFAGSNVAFLAQVWAVLGLNSASLELRLCSRNKGLTSKLLLTGLFICQTLALVWLLTDFWRWWFRDMLDPSFFFSLVRRHGDGFLLLRQTWLVDCFIARLRLCRRDQTSNALFFLLLCLFSLLCCAIQNSIGCRLLRIGLFWKLFQAVLVVELFVFGEFCILALPYTMFKFCFLDSII